MLIIRIAQAHPFVDGNKRITFAACIVFLQLNGYLVRNAPAELGRRLIAVLWHDVEAGILESFAGWIGIRLYLIDE